MSVLGEGEAQTQAEIASIVDDPGKETGTTQWEAWDQAESNKTTYRTVAGVLYGLAGAAAIGGVLWLGLAGDDEDDDMTWEPRLHVLPAKGGATVQSTWRF